MQTKGESGAVTVAEPLGLQSVLDKNNIRYFLGEFANISDRADVPG